MSIYSEEALIELPTIELLQSLRYEYRNFIEEIGDRHRKALNNSYELQMGF